MILREGRVFLDITEIHTGKGPGKKSGIYYSKMQTITRDLTVVILKNYFSKSFNALDLLAGSGVRGFRIEKECNANVTINEKNPFARKFILRNKELNNSNAEITDYDAEICFPKKKFDYIDIDPFGSPVPFIDLALKSIKNNGMIGITATDLPNLAGTNRRKSLMLYHAEPKRNFLKHEIGVRILWKYVAEKCMEYELLMDPILTYFGGYYYRIFFRVEKGSKKSFTMLEKIQEIYDLQNQKTGPIWIGKIHENEFLKKLIVDDYLENKEKIEEIIRHANLENILFFYSLEEISKKAGRNIPKIDNFIKIINDMGYEASRTQFHPLGIKTLMPYQKIISLFRMKDL